jgi:hypothetical protein
MVEERAELRVSLHVWDRFIQDHRIVNLCRGIEPTVIESNTYPISARESPQVIPR